MVIQDGACCLESYLYRKADSRVTLNIIVSKDPEQFFCGFSQHLTIACVVIKPSRNLCWQMPRLFLQSNSSPFLYTLTIMTFFLDQLNLWKFSVFGQQQLPFTFFF
jgi:hypothetical protein